ncbi:AraC family transcriptional regulator [Scleromatobacter humisilvae]|uniref:AraC family transcriptional regulator n=1 Tax=Scleromatobacter humisilvae TaxID=2897159 RepID=A0A9X2C045_9BURK|nr:AraC family transcriptional regulator [Scleromatobacter humisilvae]MCK9684319.1 AraC family transcriptional regulator [Scleromatobacter humisilvae]
MPRPDIAHPPLPQPTSLVPPIYARLLRMLLQHADVDGDRVLAAAGLDWATLVTDDKRLGRDTIVRLAEGAMAATRRPWLGLDLGGGAPVSAHGALGYAVVTSRDLREAVTTLARYGTTRNDAMAWTCVDTATGMTMQATERADLGARVRTFVIDTVLSAILRMLETAVGQIPADLRIELPLATPAWREQYQRFGVADIRFDRPAFAFHFVQRDLALPCIGADAKAHAGACRECEEALAEVAGASLAQRVAGLLASVANVSGSGAYPRMADVAARCGISPRTLIRRLHEDGATFQQLLDAARKQRALWMLLHTAEPVEEIAARLGYADTSNFSRTVRRWFGATPRELRETGGGPAPAS